MDMTKLLVPFCNSANTPKISLKYVQYLDLYSAEMYNLIALTHFPTAMAAVRGLG